MANRSHEHISTDLTDGFASDFKFSHHKLQVRGIQRIEMPRDLCSREFRDKEQFVSWDSLQIILWECVPSERTPRIIRQLKFAKSQPNFINSIVFIPKMKVFLAAALDMTFKVYDKVLNIIETIKHGERAILSMEYDEEKNVIIVSGASGVSVWRLVRNVTLDVAHIMEKLYNFDGCSEWVSKLIYEPKVNRIYALRDRSVHILSFRKRGIVTKLENIHESPVSTICWYGRSQFYITGCTEGLIKCWTSHYHKVLGQNSPSRRQHQSPDIVNSLSNNNNNNGELLEEETGNNSFALLHTFTCHKKGVTAITLHAVSGLAISSSLDGWIKVLNLEAFCVLFAVDSCQAVTSLRTIQVAGGGMACLFAQSDGTVQLWRVSSCCNFFAVTPSIVESVTVFDNIQLQSQLSSNYKAANKRRKSLESSVRDITSDDREASEVMRNSSWVNHNQQDEDDDEGEGEEDDGVSRGSTSQLHSRSRTHADLMTAETAVGNLDGCVISRAGQDLRVIGVTGNLVCHVDPQAIVEGVRCSIVSVYQQLLICLVESGHVRIHCMRSPTCPLLLDVPMRSNMDIDQGTCLTLVNCMPMGSARPGGTHDSLSSAAARDVRQARAHRGFCELVVVGTRGGALMFLDTVHGFETVYIVQVNQGPIEMIKFLQARQELIIFAHDVSGQLMQVKVLSLPNLNCVTEVSGLSNVTCYNVSVSLGFFGVGGKDGHVKLFQVSSVDSEGNCAEIMRQSQVHEGVVTALSFCDELRVFASCSSRSQVLFWTYDKQLLRRIQFNMSCHTVAFHGFVGDLLMTQGSYVLKITKDIWDAGNVLQTMLNCKDPWASDLNGDIMSSEDVLLLLDDKHSLSMPIDSPEVIGSISDKSQCDHVPVSGSNSIGSTPGFFVTESSRSITELNTLSNSQSFTRPPTLTEKPPLKKTNSARLHRGAGLRHAIRDASPRSRQTSPVPAPQTQTKPATPPGKVLNVRHPRMLIHCKPSAVATADCPAASDDMQQQCAADNNHTTTMMATQPIIDTCMMSGEDEGRNSPDLEPSDVIYQPPTPMPTRNPAQSLEFATKVASMGLMSPRARITMLSTVDKNETVEDRSRKVEALSELAAPSRVTEHYRMTRQTGYLGTLKSGDATVRSLAPSPTTIGASSSSQLSRSKPLLTALEIPIDIENTGPESPLAMPATAEESPGQTDAATVNTSSSSINKRRLRKNSVMTSPVAVSGSGGISSIAPFAEHTRAAAGERKKAVPVLMLPVMAAASQPASAATKQLKLQPQHKQSTTQDTNIGPDNHALDSSSASSTSTRVAAPVPVPPASAAVMHSFAAMSAVVTSRLARTVTFQTGSSTGNS